MDVKFKSGLEIHQQLDSHKLFCNCPSILRQDKPDVVIERRLHVVAGESGEIDEAVKHEASRDRKFFYQGYYDNCCLVELDEEPPHQINEEALKIALQISLLMNCEIIPYSQIMRKTVINGSNVSGFQRTVLIARNGWVETEQGRVGIDAVMLEEDAARAASGKDDEETGESVKTYRLDRLGIPLVEIATAPDIKTPEQVKEVALHIGEILRACKVKRGLGTIRQDVNISIEGHPRIEIKGFQDPKMMTKTVELEVARQKSNLKHKKEKPSLNKSESSLKSEVRMAKPDGTTVFLRPMPGAARMYPETDLPLLYIPRDLINEAKSTLPRLKKEIKTELQGGGLDDEMINLILEENKVTEYRELLNVYKNPNLIAKILILWKREIASHEKISEKEIEKKITIDIVESILNLIKDKEIDEGHAKKIMLDIVLGKNPNDALKVEKVSNLEDEVLRIVMEKPGLSANAYMGLVMAKFKGKVSGKAVADILKKIVK